MDDGIPVAVPWMEVVVNGVIGDCKDRVRSNKTNALGSGKAMRPVPTHVLCTFVPPTYVVYIVCDDGDDVREWEGGANSLRSDPPALGNCMSFLSQDANRCGAMRC